ncbi:MAG: folate family ECF transporter S component [Lachnospiraceae bacterium]|jgi:ECF transporter S component (folate family)|nr:folate family ECF transporter S component [Lachnospiraceae bacterium]
MNKWNTKKMAMLGVLVALQIVASRLLGIRLSPTLRVSISDSFILLAGIWLGPVAGALVGCLADLVGCVISGDAPFLLLTVSPVAVGLLAGLLSPVFKKSKNILIYGGLIAVISLLTSVLYRSWAFSQMFGAPFITYVGPRAVQAVVMVILNTLVVYGIYRSPVTAMIETSGE